MFKKRIHIKALNPLFKRNLNATNLDLNLTTEANKPEVKVDLRTL